MGDCRTVAGRCVTDRTRPPYAGVLRGTLAVLMTLAGLGCAGSGARGGDVRATAGRFARALEEHRFEAAYGMMGADYRSRVTLEGFVTALEANPEETAALSDALAQPGSRVEQRASVVYAPDQSPPGQVEFVYEAGAWVVASDVAAFYDQRTPRAALRSFVQAMARRRYDVVLRLMPDADKAGVTVERMHEIWQGEGRQDAERIVYGLRNHLDAPIELVGNRATMPYGDGKRVQFLLESGRWKIEDPE